MLVGAALITVTVKLSFTNVSKLSMVIGVNEELPKTLTNLVFMKVLNWFDSTLLSSKWLTCEKALDGVMLY